MGITEDIQWLKSNERGALRIFTIVAGGGPCTPRAVKESYAKDGDWWPVKMYIKMLTERGLIEEKDGTISLTDYGRKVVETLKATEGLAAV
jgi:hypothetical protein